MADEARAFRPVFKAFLPTFIIGSLFILLSFLFLVILTGINAFGAVFWLVIVFLPVYGIFRGVQILRNTRYEARDEGLFIHHYIFSPSDTLLLWNQVQEVEEKAGIANRIMGVKALLVSTMSAQSQASGYLGSLDEVQADELKEIISQKTAKAHAPAAKASKAGAAPKYAEPAATWAGGESPYQINASNGVIAMLLQTAPFALVLPFFASESAIIYLL